MSMIEIKNFSKQYGHKEAVKQLNLSIQKGEIVGFVGKNGAGKSTTIRALMNLIQPSSGTMRINNLDVTTHSKVIKQHLSYMPSETVFYEHLKVSQILKFCLEFST